MGSQNSSEIDLKKEENMFRQAEADLLSDDNDSVESVSLSKQIQRLQSYLALQASKNIFVKPKQKQTIIGPHQSTLVFTPLFRDVKQSVFQKQNSNGRLQSPFSQNSDFKSQVQQCEVTIEDSIVNRSTPPIRDEDVYDYYDVIEKIGKGSNGQIFKVEQKATREVRTLKIISKVSFHEKTLIRGQDEIENLWRLNHPNIVRLLEIYQNCNKYFLILQYLNGMNLYEYLKEQTVSQSFGKKIIKQTLEGLVYMHREGIVHRNIRLENIMICQDNTVEGFSIKIIDFRMSLSEAYFRKKHRHTYGSIYFAPPESIDGHITYKYDVWSMGILTLALFFEHNPFSFMSQIYLLDILRKGDIYRQNIKKLPHKIKEFVLELLVLKNKRRPSAQETLKLEWISGQKGLLKTKIRRQSNQDEQSSFKHKR